MGATIELYITKIYEKIVIDSAPRQRPSSAFNVSCAGSYILNRVIVIIFTRAYKTRYNYFKKIKIGK